MDTQRPLLSLVTGTLNRPAQFARLVNSIRERTKEAWELIVSDASDEPYYTDQYRTDPRIVIIPERPRAGCVKGYNKAFSIAMGKWVIYLNDDAEVMPGYSTAAIKFMEEHPEVGLGCLYYAESTLPYIVNEYHHIRYANFGIISKELGDRIGWFLDTLTMYGNDNSLTFKVLLEGKGVVGIPAARIWHHVVLDKWKMENQRFRNADANELMRVFRKHLPQMLYTYKKFDHLQGPSSLNM